MSHPSRVRMTGPLVAYLDGLWSDLLRLGYSPLSARNLLRVAAHLSRWLQALVFEVDVADPWLLVGLALCESGAAGAASYLPARLATRVDPATAFREE